MWVVILTSPGAGQDAMNDAAVTAPSGESADGRRSACRGVRVLSSLSRNTNETNPVRGDAGRWPCRNGLRSVVTRGAGRAPVAATARASHRRGVHGAARDPERLARRCQHPAQRRAHSRCMDQRGVERAWLSLPACNPVVFGEIRTPGATRTIGFYAHYDGQPLDPKEWTTPPFTPTLRDKAIEAGGTVIPLPAPGTPFDPECAHLRALGRRRQGPDHGDAGGPRRDPRRRAALSSNIKFVFDGEEEAGSPNLRRSWTRTRTLFAADVWLMCDGPVHQTAPALYFGARDGDAPRSHRLRREARAAQRPLRQLGAEPGDAARAPARVDEETTTAACSSRTSTTMSRR